MPIFRVPRRRKNNMNADVTIVGGKQLPNSKDGEPRVYSSSQTRARAPEIHTNDGQKIKVQSHERSRPRRNK